jgi:hypothetical protein
MRILAVTLTALAALSFVSLTAEPADAMAVCVYDDVYNTAPWDSCDAVVCTGWNQDGWQTCYPEIGPCTCPPPQEPLRVALQDLVA